MSFLKVDAEYGRKQKAENRRMSKVNKKRWKQFTTITPVGKKTKWYY